MYENMKKKNKIYRYRLLLLIFIIFTNCSIPFIGSEKKSNGISIFNDKQYLDINEYSFREYQWNKDSKTAEEVYVKGLDYFFNKNYQRAIVIFNSALKFYKKDARIYTRLAECYARANELNKAVTVLNECANELYGYDTIPEIVYYRKELNDRINVSLQITPKKKKNIFIRILTYPARIF